MQQQAGDDPNHSGHEEFAERNPRRRSTQPLAGEQSEEHRAEGRDETQREISAAVIHEGMSAGEEIEEPAVECDAGVHILRPMGGPSRGWVKRPGEPRSEERRVGKECRYMWWRWQCKT